MNPRLKISPDDVVFQQAATGGTWYVLCDCGPFHDAADSPSDHANRTDDEVADWPDLVPDTFTRDAVEIADRIVNAVAPAAVSMWPNIALFYDFKTGDWSGTVAVKPRGEVSRFVRASGPSPVTVMAELHAAIVTPPEVTS